MSKFSGYFNVLTVALLASVVWVAPVVVKAQAYDRNVQILASSVPRDVTAFVTAEYKSRHSGCLVKRGHPCPKRKGSV